jgi:calcineurin-like phosphoesterase family protein
MNRALINNINATVAANDKLYILGDFSFRITAEDARRLLNMIQCENIYLIRGNHDKNWGDPNIKNRFREVSDYKELKTEEGLLLCLMHYPLLEWKGSRRLFSLNLHGHQHHQGRSYNLDNFSRGIFRFDVGVDANDYKPVSLTDIISLRELYQDKGKE